MRDHCLHSRWTDPGRHEQAVLIASGDVRRAISIIGGLLVHADQLALYGLGAGHAGPDARKTLSASDRLDRVVDANPAPITVGRDISARELGTCRDYAIMLCAFLRTGGIEARVRCGFANYFTAGAWEDHWICEYRSGGQWGRADAQLDTVHRRALDIRFDPAQLPEDAFRTAEEACRDVLVEGTRADAYGHGDYRGAWFLRVNLVRDQLALRDLLTSDWDTWREAATDPSPQDEHLASIRADLASGGTDQPVPFWLANAAHLG